MFHTIFGCFLYKKWLPKTQKKKLNPGPTPLIQDFFLNFVIFLVLPNTLKQT